jgi:hypothetical protein
MTTVLEGDERSASRPGRSLPPGKTQDPLYGRLVGLQGQSWQVRKISPPPGFDPQTVQPVASRYTDYAIRPTHWNITELKKRFASAFQVRVWHEYMRYGCYCAVSSQLPPQNSKPVHVIMMMQSRSSVLAVPSILHFKCECGMNIWGTAVIAQFHQNGHHKIVSLYTS